MTALAFLAVALAFVAGVGAGWLWRGWSDRHGGHTRRMRFPSRFPLFRLLSAVSQYSKPIGVGLVVVALLSNAALGFLLIEQRRASDRSDLRFTSLVRCLQDYNELDGKARDERSAKAGEQTAAGIAWLTQLRNGIARRSLSAEKLNRTIVAYRAALRGAQDAQLANPYPEPDYCAKPENVKPLAPEEKP